MSYEDQNGNSWSSWTNFDKFVLQRGRELMFFCPSKGTWACHQGHTHRTYFASLRPRFDRLIQSSARLHQSVRRFYCGATSLMGWVLPRNISAESLGKTVSAWWCSFDDAVLWSCQGARHTGHRRTHIEMCSPSVCFFILHHRDHRVAQIQEESLPGNLLLQHVWEA